MKKIFTNNFELQQIQDNVLESFKDLGVNYILNGELVQDVSLVSGTDQAVSHKLSRKPNGFIVVDKNANADVWQSTTVNNIKDRVLLLRASATVKISLWIF
jgi:hypothetical protein